MAHLLHPFKKTGKDFDIQQEMKIKKVGGKSINTKGEKGIRYNEKQKTKKEGQEKQQKMGESHEAETQTKMSMNNGKTKLVGKGMWRGVRM